MSMLDRSSGAAAPGNHGSDHEPCFVFQSSLTTATLAERITQVCGCHCNPKRHNPNSGSVPQLGVQGWLPCPETTLFPQQLGSLFQEDLPVVLQAVPRSSPRVVLEEDKAIVELFLTAQIGTRSSLFQSFLSVNVVSVKACRAWEVCAVSVFLLPTGTALSSEPWPHCRG